MRLKLSESTLECAFTSCKKQVTHKSEAVLVALYNAHIATHITMGTDRAATKSRIPVEEPNIEDGNPLVDQEFIESALKSLKMSTNINPG